MALDTVDATLVRIAPVFAVSRIRVPSSEALRQVFRAGDDRATFADAVQSHHVALLSALTVADGRLGKAYTLGRCLHEMHDTRSGTPLTQEFRFHRVVGLCQSLEDLRSWFPPHAARAVAGSLRAWRDWISDHAALATSPDPDVRQKLRDRLLRQGDLWHGLLTGDQCGTDVLRSTDYVDAALRTARQSQSLAGRLVRQYAVTLVVVALALAAATVTAALTTGVARILSAVLAMAAAVGITWKGVGASVAHLAGALREPLWTREIDGAVACAIDQRPDGSVFAGLEPGALDVRRPRILPVGEKAPTAPAPPGA